MAQFGPDFLLPQGSYPASGDLKPSDPVEAFLSRCHVVMEGFLGCVAVSTTVAFSHLMEW